MPDGSSVLFWGSRLGGQGDGIHRVNKDGTNLQTIVDWPGGQQNPAVSPDGTQVVFESDRTPGGEPTAADFSLWIVNSDGSGAHPVGGLDAFADTGSASFSPDGTQLAFSGRRPTDRETDYGIFVVSTDGSGLHALVDDGYTNWGSSWSPDASRIIYYDQNSVWRINTDADPYNGERDEDYAFEVVGPPSQNPAYRQPSTSFDYYDYLAAEYRPNLYFDSSEKWRPLDADRFAAERDEVSGQPVHKVCAPGSPPACEPLTGLADLARFPSSGSFLDVAGEGDEGAYHSPYAECQVDGIRDCAGGERHPAPDEFPESSRALRDVLPRRPRHGWAVPPRRLLVVLPLQRRSRHSWLYQ